MPENNNVIFKTSTNKTINDLFNWDKSTGELTPNFDANEGVPFSSGTLYFTSDGHLIFDTQIKNKITNQLENTRLWMSKNAYSAIYAEDVAETNTDITNAIKYSIHYVEGPTTDTNPGTWTGTINGITELYDGLTIIYVPAVAGGSSTTTLNINELGAKTCYYSNTSAITTHYSVGTPILLTYRNNCWRRADYNSNNTDYKVRQTSINSNDNNNYRILLSNSANDTSEDSISKKNANLIYNPTKNKLSTGNLDLTGNINVVGDATFNNTTTIDNAILNNLLVSGNSSFVNNVNFTQIPTAPTAAAGTNTTQIATTEFVTNAVAQGFVANDAMVFKGLIGSNQLITQLPTSGYNAGWTYRVANAGIFAGEYCEVGDLLIAINDGPVSGSSVIDTHWGKVEHNIDGAVFRGSDARNSSVGSSTQPVYVNDSGIVTAITSLEVEAGGTGENNRRKAGLFYNWTTSLQGQIWSRICYIPYTNSITGSAMILNIRHTRSGVVYNETVMITVHHNSRGNITSLSSSNYNQNTSIQIRALVNSSGNCYIELKDSSKEITEGTAISPVYCALQIITLGNDEPDLYTSFQNGTTLPENYSIAAEVALGRNRITTSGIFSGNLEGNAATATTASKLSNTSKIGDTNKPVYFKADGTPAAINYTIATSVPSGAVFTDRYVNSAAFTDDSTNTVASPVKMTLTRAGSDTATVTANIPKVSSSSAGVVPKGTTVSSQSQSTKFLREDGTWAAPSYTVNTNTDTLVKQTAKSDDKNYKILFTTSNSPTSGNANEAAYDTNITINPSTHTLTATNLKGILSTQDLKRPTGLRGINDVTLQALVNTTRANRLAFLPADQIIIEKTTDGGKHWTDAGISDAEKLKLFSEQKPTINLPMINNARSMLCGLRITITAMKYNVPDGTPETEKYNYWNSTYVKKSERYCQLKEMYFWLTSLGDSIGVTVQRATGSNSNNWSTVFNDSNFYMNGWPNCGYINFSQSTFGGGGGQTENIWNYRITLMTKGINGTDTMATSSTSAPQNIMEIRGYGDTVWNSGNNYMSRDHIYKFDENQNTTFPANVTATKFVGPLQGNAATATTLATGSILPITQGGTNSSTILIANRLMRSNSNGNAIVCSSNIYSDGSKLGVNTSSVTGGYYFEVNGTSLFKDNVFIGTDSDTITKNIFVKNANGTIALTAGTSGARGLYDTTNNRWMLYYSPGVSNDSSGIVRISTWANKGSSSTPIYFNSNGEPQSITSPLPVTLGGTGQSNTNNFVKVYSRSQMGNSINYDNPGVNGLFEAMRSSEITVTGKWPGGNDHEGYFPLLSLSTSVAMMQIAGNTASNYGWWIRGKQGTNVTLEGVDWERLVTNSGTWDINITGNAATATTAGGITSAGTTAQFWRGDNSWSNILAQPAETTLGIDTSDLRIGRAIRTLHIATSDNGTGAGITDGDAAGITFGFSNAAYSAAYAGIYYQSSAYYGSRLYFATTDSFGNGAYARMMITHDGKVGIGTLSPSTRLHVDGGVTVTSLNASQAVSTDANKKLVSTNLTTADPTASGTGISYIATISQSATGKITATKSTIRSASTSQTGVIQFTSANTSAQINTLSTGSSVPYDDDYFISQYANGGISNTNYYRRPISTLYTYIKNKALANESDFLPNLKVNPITIQAVSGKKSYLDIETLLRWFITTEKISTSLQYHKTFVVGWEFASNDYLQFTYDGQNYEFNLAGTVIEFIGKTAGINETTNKADGQFRLILHVPPANPPAQTAGYVVPGYGSYIKYSVNGSGTYRSSKLTFINNTPQYYANEKIEYAASYNKTPEVANIKLNGNTSATAASTKNVQLVYDTSLEVLNFVFS